MEQKNKSNISKTWDGTTKSDMKYMWQFDCTTIEPYCLICFGTIGERIRNDWILDKVN